MLRFGHRAAAPRIVFALTPAPPVALLVAEPYASEVRTVKELAGGKVGFTTPGSPEHSWLQALLARDGIAPSRVDLVSLGTRGVVAALDAGEVKAAFVAEPAATALVRDGRGRLLVDLRSPRAVSDALGTPTVNAVVFVRGDRRPSDRDLTAFARAVLAAERLIASERPEALAAGLSRSVLGTEGEFERRVETTRGIYLPDGLVSAAAVGHTIEIIRAHLPLPRTLRIPRPADMLHLEPLRRAIRSRPPA